MRKSLVLICALFSLFFSAQFAGSGESYVDGFGYLWQPNGWVYVSNYGDMEYNSSSVVYDPSEESWMWIQAGSSGPLTYSFIGLEWFLGFGWDGWRYFQFEGDSGNYSEYFFYNIRLKAWHYSRMGPSYVWYYNLTRGYWGRIR